MIISNNYIYGSKYICFWSSITSVGIINSFFFDNFYLNLIEYLSNTSYNSNNKTHFKFVSMFFIPLHKLTNSFLNELFGGSNLQLSLIFDL